VYIDLDEVEVYKRKGSLVWTIIFHLFPCFRSSLAHWKDNLHVESNDLYLV
jgi:hypothetical protein